MHAECRIDIAFNRFFVLDGPGYFFLKGHFFLFGQCLPFLFAVSAFSPDILVVDFVVHPMVGVFKVKTAHVVPVEAGKRVAVLVYI